MGHNSETISSGIGSNTLESRGQDSALINQSCPVILSGKCFTSIELNSYPTLTLRLTLGYEP